MKAKKSQAPAGSVERKQKRRAKKSARPSKKRQPVQGLREIHRHAAGIDVGAEEHYVAVAPQSVPEGQSAVRSFSAFTGGLDALVEWLKQCGVTTAAIESTGVYWIPLFQKLAQAGIEGVLANAAHPAVAGQRAGAQDRCEGLPMVAGASCGVDLTAVMGLNILSSLILISEIGTDMSRRRNAKAFCS